MLLRALCHHYFGDSNSEFNLENEILGCSNPKTLRIWTFLQLTQALLVPQTRHDCSA